jgi:hypothetical protein
MAIGRIRPCDLLNAFPLYAGSGAWFASDDAGLIRIGTFTDELERLHLWGTDDDIDGEFNSVCRRRLSFSISKSGVRCFQHFPVTLAVQTSCHGPESDGHMVRNGSTVARGHPDNDPFAFQNISDRGRGQEICTFEDRRRSNCQRGYYQSFFAQTNDSRSGDSSVAGSRSLNKNGPGGD